MTVDRLRVAVAALDERNSVRPGTDVEARWVRDRLLMEGIDVDEDTIRDVMHDMADLGLLEETDGLRGPIFRALGAPSECQDCGAPFPEAGRHKIESYDADGDRYETVHICGSCISERY